MVMMMMLMMVKCHLGVVQCVWNIGQRREQSAAGPERRHVIIIIIIIIITTIIIFILIMMLRLIVIALKKSHQVFRRTKAVQKSHSPPVNALEAGSGKKIMGCLGNLNWC